MLCAFTGEEQGLFGSRAKAEEQAEEGLDILAMFALDMLAYRREGAPPQVGLPIRNHDHVLSLFTGLMFNRYVPAVTVRGKKRLLRSLFSSETLSFCQDRLGTGASNTQTRGWRFPQVCTTTACCSDNTAYHEQGFSSTFIFESCPGLDDPDLHTPRDDMGGPGSLRECPSCMDMVRTHSAPLLVSAGQPVVAPCCRLPSSFKKIEAFLSLYSKAQSFTQYAH
jgi:hypothetical protein